MRKEEVIPERTMDECGAEIEPLPPGVCPACDTAGRCTYACEWRSDEVEPKRGAPLWVPGAELIIGDAMPVMAQYAVDTFDCIMVDPPYGQTGLAWDRRVHGWPSLARRILKRTGSMWVFGSMQSFMATADQFHGWKIVQDIVWEKQNGSGFHADRFRRVHEQAVQFRRDDAPWSGVYRSPQFTHDAKARKVHAKATRVPHTGKIGAHVYETTEGGPRLMRSVLQVRNCHRQGIAHATPKPEALLEHLIRYACPPGGRILDPFAGSGSTGMVAQRLGLVCTLIENDPEIADAADLRLYAAREHSSPQQVSPPIREDQ